MGRRPSQQSRHANQQGQPMQFDPRCHDTPRALDTKESPSPDGVQSTALNKQLSSRHRHGVPIALRVL
ncbi:Uncharacterised protein [Acinetobacter baumannii]|nr:Uncharacterised protein [Acinetobacter baumannii]